MSLTFSNVRIQISAIDIFIDYYMTYLLDRRGHLVGIEYEISNFYEKFLLQKFNGPLYKRFILVLQIISKIQIKSY